MSLSAGDELLHYRLIDKIGEGGMGVVWKALDTSLDREVAIKILPDAVAQDGDRLARFEREARLLATLNHPGIAAVYGLHLDGGTRFLAMELVPGEHLGARLARGPLEPEEALRIARAVAEALEAAHASGVIHRDLKPANIQLCPDGKVKVLDFGLAKAFEREGTSSGSDPSVSPTLTSAGTVAGVILGTAAYMSPQQARGHAVDRRADVWSFGCVLYEMLTGRRAFAGDTVSDTLASVLRATPEWDALPQDTPRAVRRVLRRTLEKDAGRRLHDVADARIEIEDALDGRSSEPAERDAPESRRTSWIPWGIAAAALVIAIAGWTGSGERGPTPASRPLHVSVTAPQELEMLSSLPGGMIASISPDGERLAYVAREADTVRLFLRSLTTGETIVVPDSEQASDPFFSPNGEWIAFFARGKLRKASVAGGRPVALADVQTPRGGAWIDDESILFAPDYMSGLYRIPAAGGAPEEVTAPDREANERSHRWPDVLPGGKVAIFTIGTLDQPGYYEDATLAVVDLETGTIRPVIEGGSIARFAGNDRVIYSREGELLQVGFDPDRQEAVGAPTSVLAPVLGDITSGVVQYGLSRDGILMYMPARNTTHTRNLVWVDRDGRATELTETGRPFLTPRISPDGSKVAFGAGPGLGDGDIWVYDTRRDMLTRLTFDSDSITPVWSAGGARISFGVTTGGEEGIKEKPSDGSADAIHVVRDGGRTAAIVDGIVPGTGDLVFSRAGGLGGSDLMIVREGSDAAEELLVTSHSDAAATFSPDGKWMAYVSDESGEFEIYVRPLDDRGGRWQISGGGGKGPIWSRDGSEVFYTHGDRLMAVPVEAGETFSHGVPLELFRYDFERSNSAWANFDAAPDGRRFLMVQRPRDEPPAQEIRLILGFAAD